MSYQGHANYETWVIMGMYIKNDKQQLDGWRKAARKIAKSAYRAPLVIGAIWTTDQYTLFTLEDTLREKFTERADNLNLPAPWGDLIAASLSDVNWGEIARELIEEA